LHRESILKTPRTLIHRLPLCLVLFGCNGETNDGSADGETSTSGGSSSTSVQTSATTSSDDSTGTSTAEDSSDTGTTASADEGDDSSDEGSTTSSDALVVTLETTLGDIVIALDEVAAPITTANFVAYVESGFYDGSDGLGATVFHRVIPGFMIQGGGLTESLSGKTTMAPIMNESGNGLSNVRGTIAMARTQDPDSATAQFFINVENNLFLDEPPGYAVFGEVVEGMDVVDDIVAVETAPMGAHQDAPVEPIIILSATLH
jgi:cyclophilin family peptidyl-prolyl cis-trans isomerase